ncbi:MAG: hypothetical protein HC923_04215 [Myxococcales bacterium]|nr:hypothetical protein [Myxococcales bacterium]
MTDGIDPKRLSLVGEEGQLAAVGVLAAGALGNLPSQDLLQRIFASKSEGVARAACIGAGIVYLCLGAAPVALGLLAPRFGVTEGGPS